MNRIQNSEFRRQNSAENKAFKRGAAFQTRKPTAHSRQTANGPILTPFCCLLTTLSLIIFATSSYAQRINTTPKQYFNEAAYLYSDNKTDKALEVCTEGVNRYPNDMELKKLKELLEKQQQQEQQQDQQQNQDQQEQQDQNQKDQKNKQNDDKNKQNQDQKDKKDEQKDKKDQKNDKDQQNQQQQPKKAEQMTPEEAKMLLDAMRDDEQAQRDAMRMIMGSPEPPQNGKDW